MKKIIKILSITIVCVLLLGYIILGPLSFGATVARVEIYNESFPSAFKKELDEINAQFERYNKFSSMHIVTPPDRAHSKRCVHGNPIYDKDYCSSDGACRFNYPDTTKEELQKSSNFIFSGIFKTKHYKSSCPYYIGRISFSRDINFAAFRYTNKVSSLAKKHNLDIEIELSHPW